MAKSENEFQALEPETPSGRAAAHGGEAEDPAALDAADLRIGGYVAIAMFVAGAALLPVTALPIREMVTPGAVVAIGAVSLGCAGAFAALSRAGRITQDSLYVGDYIWVALTAALVAASGGKSSPFFLLYPLPVLHAGAFQSRSRMVAVTAVAVLAFLTPLAYDTGGTALFSAMAIIAVPPTVVVAWSLNAALTTLRVQRRELAAAERVARQQALSDPLTGLGNSRLLWTELEAQASRARRHHEQFSLIVLDLNRFKVINDEVGHREGDAALQAVATALRSGLRTEDICCRHGGDEFTVIAVGAGELEARELAGRLIDAVARVRVLAGGERGLGATAGWATFEDPAQTAEDLMRDADVMLRERKYGHSYPGGDVERFERPRPPVSP
jgi:diguanylate cyclase (GGDEF)-like protein